MKKFKPAGILLLCLVLIGLVSWISFGSFPGLENRSAQNIHLGLDLAGGVSITYQAKDGIVPAEEEMQGALSVIQRRLDSKGYTEANAFIDGTNRIRVEIPGVEDASKAVEEIGRTAMLQFVGLSGMGTYQSGADILAAVENGEAEIVLTGVNVANATFQKGRINAASGIEPYVKLEFDAEGAKMFADATARYIGKQIAIMLDDTVVSAPVVQAAIRISSIPASALPWAATLWIPVCWPV